MLEQGLTLTIVGMLVVFSFLTFLVAMMSLMSYVVNHFFPEKEMDTPIKKNKQNNIKLAIALAATKARTSRGR